MSKTKDITAHRPWGYFQVLSNEESFKVKKIVVYPGKRLSLQLHKQRSEHWHVVHGDALVTVDDKKICLQEGNSVDIAKAALHRIENTGTNDLCFIEIQRGEYFGEDDIERVEDDFGRV
jgi:mannose-6-phosphate isomerase-like protein (cupin superfamily)